MSNSYRVTFGVDEQKEAGHSEELTSKSLVPTIPTVRGGQGVIQSDGSGNLKYRGVERYNPREDHSVSSDDLLRTGRNNFGQPLNDYSSINRNTMFKVNGVEVDAEGAVRLGLLRKGVNGSYESASSAPSEVKGYGQSNADVVAEMEQMNQARAEAQALTDAITQRAGGAFDAINEAVEGDPRAYENVMRGAITALYTEGTSEATTAHLAGLLKMDRNQTVDFVQDARDRIERGVSDYISSRHGLSGQEVLDWAFYNISHAEKASLANRVTLGDNSAVEEIVSRYKSRKR